MKHFEVKSGDNKGLYIVATEPIQDLEDSPSWGRLSFEFKTEFFRKHGIHSDWIVYTHTKFASVKFWKSYARDNLALVF